MTTEPRRRSDRLSKPLLRAWATIVAAVSFFAPAASFAMHTTTTGPANAEADGTGPDVIIRKVIRRVVIEASRPGTAPRVVYVSSPTSAVPSSTAPTVTAPVATTGGS